MPKHNNFGMQRLTPPSLAALDFGEASFLQWHSTLVKTVLDCVCCTSSH